ncbi:MAG TPA: hypothetical protein PKL57_05395, partial [Candidatus Wallbacteria bacterium]|nr:hypothetical protein [Candidatus Wallbacteria bacterium]
DYFLFNGGTHDATGKWAGLRLEGPSGRCVFKNAFFAYMNSIDLTGSAAGFEYCDFIGDLHATDKSFTLTLDDAGVAGFYRSNFSMYYPAYIDVKKSSFCALESNDFDLKSGNSGTFDSAFITVADKSFLKASGNVFQAVMTAIPGFKGSKIRLEAQGYIYSNSFNSPSGVFMAIPVVASGTSSEICVSSPDGKIVLPVIKNNVFTKCMRALHIKGAGYDTSSIALEDRIVNNKFINCNEILRVEVSMDNDFVKTPTNAATDADGNIYMTDSATNCVYKYSPNGDQLLKFGGAGTGDGQFDSPAAIAINDTGEIYVADKGNKRIQKFDKNGRFILKFGTP